MALAPVDPVDGKEPVTDERKLRSVKLASVAIAAIVVTSLALAYSCTDVFEGFTHEATIHVNSICYSEDVQYEVFISDTGVKLASGTVVPNGSETHEFRGFDKMGVTFRYSVFPDQEFECPFLLSDGEVLQINVFPLGSVGWQHSY